MPRYKLSLSLLFLYLLLIYPLSGMLPDWASFENGPLENAQVIVLLGGALLCIHFAHYSQGSPTHGMWLPSAGIFLILAFRELSWGRVFMVKGYSAIGEPIIPGSSEMPFHTAIHVGVGIAAVLCLYFLIRYAPWKRIFREIRLPLAQLALIITPCSIPCGIRSSKNWRSSSCTLPSATRRGIITGKLRRNNKSLHVKSLVALRQRGFFPIHIIPFFSFTEFIRTIK